MRSTWLALPVVMLTAGAAPPGSLPDLVGETRWGEHSDELARQFGSQATRLAAPLDYGDSYVDLALRDERIAGYPFVVFFQMDKRTGGLKRIHVERQRHGANPPVFRAMLADLRQAYGEPTRRCDLPVQPKTGYQAATELIWRRDAGTVRLTFRDTTIEALEGHNPLPEEGPVGVYGLTGQLFVQVAAPGADGGQCR